MKKNDKNSPSSAWIRVLASQRFQRWTLLYITIIFAGFILINHQLHRATSRVLPSGTLQLVATQLQYKLGQTVSVKLLNNLDTPVVMNLRCPQEPLSVYRWEQNRWVRIHDTIETAKCGAPTTVTVASGGTYTVSYANWSSLFNTPGIYRVAALATNYDGLAYTDFIVQAPPVTVKAPAPQIQPIYIYKPVYVPIYVPSGGGGGDSSSGSGDH